MPAISKSWQRAVRRSRPMHASMHIAWFGLALLVGVFLSSKASIPIFGQVLWLVVAFASVVVTSRTGRRIFLGVTLLCGLIAGIARGTMYANQLAVYDAYISKSVRLSGVVSEDPTLQKSGSLRLTLRSVQLDGQAATGKVWLDVPPSTSAKRSDLVAAEGQLRTGYGTIAAAMTRPESVVITRNSENDYVLRLRDYFSEKVRSVIDEPFAALGMGFLFGQKSALPEELTQNLRLLGLTHIVVASGYNLTILVSFARKLLFRVSRYSALIGGLALVAGFVLVTGFTPSMSRAGLVASLSLIAWYFGRTIKPFVLLSMTAAFTVLVNPQYVWGDIGWYLSFLAFIGILALAPLIKSYFFADKDNPHAVRDLLIETVSAQIMTLPLLLFVFSEYAPLSLPANMLILPIIPIAMLMTFLAGIATTASGLLGGLVGSLAQLPLSYVVLVSEKLALSTGSPYEVPATWVVMTLLYGLVGLFSYHMWKRVRPVQKSMEIPVNLT